MGFLGGVAQFGKSGCFISSRSGVRCPSPPPVSGRTDRSGIDSVSSGNALSRVGRSCSPLGSCWIPRQAGLPERAKRFDGGVMLPGPIRLENG